MVGGSYSIGELRWRAIDRVVRARLGYPKILPASVWDLGRNARANNNDYDNNNNNNSNQQTNLQYSTHRACVGVQIKRSPFLIPGGGAEVRRGLLLLIFET